MLNWEQAFDRRNADYRTRLLDHTHRGVREAYKYGFEDALKGVRDGEDPALLSEVRATEQRRGGDAELPDLSGVRLG